MDSDKRLSFIDTHAHLDGPEYDADRDEMIARAKEAGVAKVFIPAIDLKSVDTVLATCARYKGYAYPMIGLHPEEVKANWQEVLQQMKQRLDNECAAAAQSNGNGGGGNPFIAIGEIGLDYYWSREFEAEQRAAFEAQVQWAVEYGLPLMIHCRKGQQDMVKILRRYEEELVGGVFHCFTGNAQEATELLSFRRFVLGIGGVLTFKKSNLPDTLSTAVPLSRIVLETDSPYMAPVPLRGKRNESAYTLHVLERLAQCYGVSPAEVATATNDNVARVFGQL